jgi:spermidine/putrescine ABC transporter ATP-binding subunit
MLNSSSFAAELDGVTKRYHAVTAVDEVSLSVEKGEFLCLLGPSGCGKTTTLRMIGGFEIPDEGRVMLGGVDVTHLPPEKRNSNMVFQNYALFPHKSVFDNIAFGLKMKRFPRKTISEKVERVLALVNLHEYGNRMPHQLSGGQQQRVALGRAVVNEPTLLLLDEPLGALDLKLRRQMQMELKGLQAKLGITFIYVTHDQEEALTMADRIAVMRDGRIVQLGQPAEIYEHPASAYVADFVGTVNMFKGTVTRHGAEGVEIGLEEGGSLIMKGGQDIKPGSTVNLAVRPEKIILSVKPREDCDLALRGSVAEVNYQGTYTGYVVALESGFRVSVTVQNAADAARATLNEGEMAYVCWSRDVVRLLAD